MFWRGKKIPWGSQNIASHTNCGIILEGTVSIHTSLSDAYVLVGWRRAKDWLRPSTRHDYGFWLVALPAKSHYVPKVIRARL